MTLYRYEGPMEAVEIGDAGEVTFVAGRLYELPDDAPLVKRLAHRGEQAAAGRKVQKGRLFKVDDARGEPVVTPKTVALKPKVGADRNLLADTLTVIRDGVRHPDAAAQAAAAVPPDILSAAAAEAAKTHADVVAQAQAAISLQREAGAKGKAAAAPKSKEG